MSYFRKKPVVVQAIRFDGENVREVAAWAAGEDLPPERLPELWWLFQYSDLSFCIVIPTLEGEMQVDPGHWIIKGVNGEFYPCKPDIFEKTYEPVDAPAASSDGGAG